MFSFIRKRFLLKHRSDKHIETIKSNHFQEKQQTHRIEGAQLTNRFNRKKMAKKKKIDERSLSADTIFEPWSTVHQVNQSFSDVDYFPLMSGAINTRQTSTKPDSSEIVQQIGGLHYVQTKTVARQRCPSPAINDREEQRVANYKDVDHPKTKVLQELIELRIQEKSFA